MPLVWIGWLILILRAMKIQSRRAWQGNLDTAGVARGW